MEFLGELGTSHWTDVLWYVQPMLTDAVRRFGGGRRWSFTSSEHIGRRRFVEFVIMICIMSVDDFLHGGSCSSLCVGETVVDAFWVHRFFSFCSQS